METKLWCAKPQFTGGRSCKAALQRDRVAELLRLTLVALLLSVSVSAFADQNSLSRMIDITSTAQANLTQHMIDYNQRTIDATRMLSQGSAPAPAPCMPPYQLQRGANAVVPPELQGHPLYQEYLRCLQAQGVSPSNAPGFPQPAPAVAARRHPITVSDFVPVTPGHPVVEQALAGMPINPQQRRFLQSAVDETFKYVASNFRGNNIAASMAFAYATANGTLTGTAATPQQVREAILNVNDAIAQNPMFPRVTTVEKQNTSDSLIFQSTMILVLQNMGQKDPDARLKSIELSRVVLRQLTGS